MPTVVACVNKESFKREEEFLKLVCKEDIIKASSIMDIKQAGEHGVIYWRI
ncbi:TPA: hypothetical protein ACX96Z_000766 [Clostridium sporogenes]